MQIGSKFTIGVHILIAIDYFKGADRVNSEFLAGSIGVNPVIVRTVISQLREAGIVQTQRGSSGAALARGLDTITLVCSIVTVLVIAGVLVIYYRKRKKDVENKK